MASKPAREQTAAEFLVMQAASVLMNAQRVSAVVVIVAMDPQPGSSAAAVAMAPWGASRVDQVSILRGLADGLERAGAAAGSAPAPTVQ